MEPEALELLEAVEELIGWMDANEPDRLERKGYERIMDAMVTFRVRVDSEAPPPDSHPKPRALAVLPRAGTQRRKVLDLIVAAGVLGRTDAELVADLSNDINDPVARRVELTRGGWVEACQDAWVLTEAGRENLKGSG